MPNWTMVDIAMCKRIRKIQTCTRGGSGALKWARTKCMESSQHKAPGNWDNQKHKALFRRCALDNLNVREKYYAWHIRIHPVPMAGNIPTTHIAQYHRPTVCAYCKCWEPDAISRSSPYGIQFDNCNHLQHPQPAYPYSMCSTWYLYFGEGYA